MVTKNVNKTQQDSVSLKGQDFPQIQQSLANMQIAYPTKSLMQILLQVLHRVQVPIEIDDSNHLCNLEPIWKRSTSNTNKLTLSPPPDYSSTPLPYFITLLPTCPGTLQHPPWITPCSIPTPVTSKERIPMLIMPQSSENLSQILNKDEITHINTMYSGNVVMEMVCSPCSLPCCPTTSPVAPPVTTICTLHYLTSSPLSP